MILKAQGTCSCGVAVNGDLDEDSREFIYRFSVPPGAAVLVKPRATTEVADGIRLVTFPPGDEWSVDCPVCQRRILLLKAS
jgi:hypothetical protein